TRYETAQERECGCRDRQGNVAHLTAPAERIEELCLMRGFRGQAARQLEAVLAHARKRREQRDGIERDFQRGPPRWMPRLRDSMRASTPACPGGGCLIGGADVM